MDLDHYTNIVNKCKIIRSSGLHFFRPGDGRISPYDKECQVYAGVICMEY